MFLFPLLAEQLQVLRPLLHHDPVVPADLHPRARGRPVRRPPAAGATANQQLRGRRRGRGRVEAAAAVAAAASAVVDVDGLVPGQQALHGPQHLGAAVQQVVVAVRAAAVVVVVAVRRGGGGGRAGVVKGRTEMWEN